MITITIMADNQEGCEHGREKAWTIDPEKVIGGGVGSSVGWNFIFIIVMMINMLIIATECKLRPVKLEWAAGLTALSFCWGLISIICAALVAPSVTIHPPPPPGL